jgi:hypothetical protein
MGVFTKLRCSSNFWEFLNYFSKGNSVEYVYSNMDQVHQARRTRSTRFIKLGPLVFGSTIRIRLGKRVSSHLILATDLWMDDYGGFFFDGLDKNRGAVRPSMAGD